MSTIDFSFQKTDRTKTGLLDKNGFSFFYGGKEFFSFLLSRFMEDKNVSANDLLHSDIQTEILKFAESAIQIIELHEINKLEEINAFYTSLGLGISSFEKRDTSHRIEVKFPLEINSAAIESCEICFFTASLILAMFCKMENIPLNLENCNHIKLHQTLFSYQNSICVFELST